MPNKVCIILEFETKDDSEVTRNQMLRLDRMAENFADKFDLEAQHSIVLKNLSLENWEVQ